MLFSLIFYENYFLFIVPPKIVPFFFDDPTYPGQFASVNCIVKEGDLPIHIEWLFNNENISSMMGIEIVQTGPRMTILSIDSVSGQHAGLYTCKAQNSAGFVSETKQLKVNGSNFDKFSLYFVTKQHKKTSFSIPENYFSL